MRKIDLIKQRQSNFSQSRKLCIEFTGQLVRIVSDTPDSDGKLTLELVQDEVKKTLSIDEDFVNEDLNTADGIIDEELWEEMYSEIIEGILQQNILNLGIDSTGAFFLCMPNDTDRGYLSPHFIMEDGEPPPSGTVIVYWKSSEVVYVLPDGGE